MIQNCVDVEITFIGLPLNDTDEHSALEDRIFDAGCKVSEFIQEHDDDVCYMPDKKYDAHLLMKQIENINSILEKSHDLEYSFTEEVPVQDVNFDVYRDLSDICKNVDVNVVVSKFGPHVSTTDDYTKPGYYNKVLTSVKSGEFISQIACHRELDENGNEFRREGDMRLILNGNECKSTMFSIRDELDVRLKSFYKSELQQAQQKSEKSALVETNNKIDRGQLADFIEQPSEDDSFGFAE